jgi:hypothetical protein
MDKLIYGILEQNAIKETDESFLHEQHEHDIELHHIGGALSSIVAAGFILTTTFIRSYKARKKLKEPCKHLKDPKQLKTCMIRGAINLLKTERKELARTKSWCMKTRNPEKCKQNLAQLVKDYDIKIKEKELQLKNI